MLCQQFVFVTALLLAIASIAPWATLAVIRANKAKFAIIGNHIMIMVQYLAAANAALDLLAR